VPSSRRRRHSHPSGRQPIGVGAPQTCGRPHRQRLYAAAGGKPTPRRLKNVHGALSPATLPRRAPDTRNPRVRVVCTSYRHGCVGRATPNTLNEDEVGGRRARRPLSHPSTPYMFARIATRWYPRGAARCWIRTANVAATDSRRVSGRGGVVLGGEPGPIAPDTEPPCRHIGAAAGRRGSSALGPHRPSRLRVHRFFRSWSCVRRRPAVRCASAGVAEQRGGDGGVDFVAHLPAYWTLASPRGEGGDSPRYSPRDPSRLSGWVAWGGAQVTG
jgi:hypothetical protein